MKAQAEEWREIARTFREIAETFERLSKDADGYKQTFGGPVGGGIAHYAGGITWIDHEFNKTSNYRIIKT